MTDAELLQVATDFRDGVLEGRPSRDMCFAVCWPLQSMLDSLYSLPCKLAEVENDERNHFFIVLADGRVLDPTADQFDGMPPVYLGEPQKIHGANK